MEKIDYEKLSCLSEDEFLKFINTAESEFKDIFENYQEATKQFNDMESTLYSLHYHYMLKYAFYKGKYIKINDKLNTIYMYVKYQIFSTYKSDAGKDCYLYKLTGNGFRRTNKKYSFDEDLYIVSNLMKIELCNEEGKLGPRKSEEVEEISKEEFENEYKKVINEHLNN